MISYVVAGCVKFAVNYFRFKSDAFAHIGLGGFPSTHTTIVTSAFVTVYLNCGANSPIIAPSLALLMIVIIDSLDLRNKVGKINLALINHLKNGEKLNLRRKVGHTPIEVLGGIALGTITALIFNISFQ